MFVDFSVLIVALFFFEKNNEKNLHFIAISANYHKSSLFDFNVNRVRPTSWSASDVKIASLENARDIVVKWLNDDALKATCSF